MITATLGQQEHALSKLSEPILRGPSQLSRLIACLEVLGPEIALWLLIGPFCINVLPYLSIPKNKPFEIGDAVQALYGSSKAITRRRLT
jgi:hypothetical protein